MGSTIPCSVSTSTQYYAVGTDKEVYRHYYIPKKGNWENYCGGLVTLIETGVMSDGKRYLFGLGMDKNIYMGMFCTLNDSKSWRRITGDFRVESFFVDGQTIYALKKEDGAIYVCSIANSTEKDVYCTAWNPLTKGVVSAFTVYDAQIFGVGKNHQVWVHKKNGGGRWRQTTQGRTGITQVEVTHNTIYGLGLDTKVYRWFKGQWRPVSTGGVTQFVVNDTHIHGLLKDQCIWRVRRVPRVGKWQYVTGPAVTHVARPFGAINSRL